LAQDIYQVAGLLHGIAARASWRPNHALAQHGQGRLLEVRRGSPSTNTRTVPLSRPRCARKSASQGLLRGFATGLVPYRANR
jgi:hypothetical protein